MNFFEDVFVSSSNIPVQPEDIDNATKAIERVKLASLYCDYYVIEPYKPYELITEKLAAETLKLADKRVEHFTKNVRPMFDHVLEINPEEIIRFQNELLGTRDVQSSKDSR